MQPTDDPVSEIEPLGVPGLGYIKLKEYISSHNELILERHFQHALNSGFGRVVILDCALLKAISSAISVLVYWSDKLKNDGGALLMVAVHPKITLVVDMLSLNEHFTFLKSVDEAREYGEKILANSSPEQS